MATYQPEDHTYALQPCDIRDFEQLKGRAFVTDHLASSLDHPAPLTTLNVTLKHPTIEIFVVILTGEAITVAVRPCCTISDVKLVIFQRLRGAATADRYSLMHEGIPLEHSHTLPHYNIHRNSRIYKFAPMGIYPNKVY